MLVENDANAAAYGEFLAGAACDTQETDGQEVRNFIAITLGTGVGGGVIIDRRIYSGSNHAGGELGHMVIREDGRLCTCGRQGCWEAYASATGLIITTKEAMQATPPPSCGNWLRATCPRSTAAPRLTGCGAGDETGAQVVQAYIRSLATGISNIVNIFQPDLLSLAGGISKEGGPRCLSPCAKSWRGRITPVSAPAAAASRSPSWANDAGVIGAALLGVSKD